MTTAEAVTRALTGRSPAAAPLMRWWWFSSHMSAAAIDADLDAMRDAGIGGVELVMVYPVSGESVDVSSPEALALVGRAARGAQERGMRFDLTLGTGWPFGGRHVDEGTAARRLHWERIELAPDVTRWDVGPLRPGDVVVGAYLGAGSLQEPPRSWEPVDAVPGALVRSHGRGPRVLLIAISRLTGQNVKRAPTGAEGFVLDHYSADAARAHLDAVAAPLLSAAGADRVHAGFCDSFEVFDADWTARLPEEFAARRGYDPLPRLWQLAVDAPGSAQLRTDLMATLTELFEENFLGIFRAWCAENGILLRAQCYGEPPMIASSYRRVDLFEGEGWGWKRWTKNAWAVSAGDVCGRGVVSSETWTWVHSPSFRASPFDLLGEAYEHLLTGVNLLVGHGWPLGAALGEGQPVFYASGAIDARNPWWFVAPALFGALDRASATMQLGRRLTQVGVYLPVGELRAMAEGEHPLDLWRQTRRFIDDDVVAAIRTRGLDLDVLDDDLLAAAEPDRYEVVLVPAGCRPTRAAERQFARLGTPTVRLTEATEPARTREIHAALTGMTPWLTTDRPADVAVSSRRVGDDSVSLVVNTGPESEVRLGSGRSDHVLTVWDVASGAVRSAGAQRETTVRLAPYEAVIVVGSPPGDDAPPLVIEDSPTGASSAPLTGWSVIDDDGPRSIALPHVWEDDPAVSRDTEWIVYEAAFDLDRECGLVLDLGAGQPRDVMRAAAGLRGSSFEVPVVSPVSAAARVSIDGERRGELWRSPFRIDVGEAGEGSHVLRIEVASVGTRATAARAVDGSGADVAGSHGARHRVQDAGSGAAGLRSGLLGEPVLLSRPI
ncbi:MAG: glycosyl hydrolase [Microbacterium sp.]